jgi:CheY-like chemotaxis protein
MAAILGYTEILEDPQVGKAVRSDAITTIRRNGEHLVTLINDILDLSKIEAGKMRVDRVSSDPRVVIRESAKLVTELAARKGIAFHCEIDPDLPARILTDPTRLRQILVNLLGNAVKFTESGRVTIRVRAEAPGCCRFEIEDTGIGMDAAHAAQAFDPFFQADSSNSRRHGGTGLGLAISARLAGMLGGQLVVLRTALGEGTVMCLTIETGATPGTANVATPGWSVRARVDTRTRERPNHSHTHNHTHPSLPHDTPDRTAPARSAPTGAPLAGARVLLAEDGPDNQRLLSYMLIRAGATVQVVSDGSLAVELLGTEPAPHYDLLLLDMQMPELDGYQTAAALRARGVAIPIIALTAHAMDGDRERCLEAGCDDYASKPISSSELIRVCVRWLDADARPTQRSARPAA